MNASQMVSETRNLSAAKYARYGYKAMLRYTAEHTHGLCAGITREDSLPFCSAADAAGWVLAINSIHAKNPARNGYRVIAHTIETL